MFVVVLAYHAAVGLDRASKLAPNVVTDSVKEDLISEVSESCVTFHSNTKKSKHLILATQGEERLTAPGPSSPL